jgi:uncharacterized protein YrrD
MQNEPPQPPLNQPSEQQPASTLQGSQPPVTPPPMGAPTAASHPMQPPPLPSTPWFTFAQLRGHPLVDVSTGEKLGEVGDLLLDPQRRMVQAFATKVGFVHLHGPLLIPAANARVGADAITVQPGGQRAAAQAGLAALPRVSAFLGMRALTTSGQLLGTVEDVRFDQNSGALLAFEVQLADAGLKQRSLGAERLVVPMSSVLSVGGEQLMVDAAALA